MFSFLEILFLKTQHSPRVKMLLFAKMVALSSAMTMMENKDDCFYMDQSQTRICQKLDIYQGGTNKKYQSSQKTGYTCAAAGGRGRSSESSDESAQRSQSKPRFQTQDHQLEDYEEDSFKEFKEKHLMELEQRDYPFEKWFPSLFLLSNQNQNKILKNADFSKGTIDNVYEACKKEECSWNKLWNRCIKKDMHLQDAVLRVHFRITFRANYGPFALHRHFFTHERLLEGKRVDESDGTLVFRRTGTTKDKCNKYMKVLGVDSSLGEEKIKVADGTFEDGKFQSLTEKTFEVNIYWSGFNCDKNMKQRDEIKRLKAAAEAYKHLHTLQQSFSRTD